VSGMDGGGRQAGANARDHRERGDEGEILAVRHLKRLGYRIIARNYRCPLGEIDIVARHRGAVVFVEVKSRGAGDQVAPKLAITPAKQHKLSQVAWHYLQTHKLTEASARFDVVAIRGMPDSPQFEVIENAFESTY
jgi:putative endonuclease